MASPETPSPLWSRPGSFPVARDFRLSALTVALAAIVGVAGASSLLAKKNYMDDPNIILIRGLDREIAVAKVPLPAGKKGVVINSKGMVDQKNAAEQLRSNGMSVRSGMPVEITKIDFRSDKVVFEINGGGKTGKKWYQHIEIGMGGPGAMEPLVPEQTQQSRTIGSYITIELPHKGANLTVAQAKQMLGSLLDFNRQAPTELYSPALPPKFKEAIKRHEVMPGMNHDAVLSAKGPPDRKVRDVKEDGSEEEDWIYGLPPHVLYVVFDGDTVKQVTQY